MNPRRPRWLVLGLIFSVGLVLRELPNWLRAWQAGHSGKPAAHRKSKTRWPWSAPAQPRVRPARPSSPRPPRRKSAGRTGKKERGKDREKGTEYASRCTIGAFVF